MKPILKTTRVTQKPASEDITNPGDFCIISSLASADAKIEAHQAIIIRCPYCIMDMASTSVHTIEMPKSESEIGIFEKIKRYLGFPHGITVSAMLQCPYNPTHTFKIIKGRILPI